MSHFPARGMKQMRQAFPKATHFAQVRLFGQDGSYVTVEGPVTQEEYQAIFANALGEDKKKHDLSSLVRLKSLAEGFVRSFDSDQFQKIINSGLFAPERLQWLIEIIQFFMEEDERAGKSRLRLVPAQAKKSC